MIYYLGKFLDLFETLMGFKDVIIAEHSPDLMVVTMAILAFTGSQSVVQVRPNHSKIL